MTRDENIVKLDIYNKSTDTFNYLHFKSCHPRRTKANIPFTLARRICTIVHDPETREQRLCDLSSRSQIKGYTNNLIASGINRAKRIDRENLLKPKEIKPKKLLPFVTTHNYNPNNNTRVIRDDMHILHGSDKMKDILKERTIISAHR